MTATWRLLLEHLKGKRIRVWEDGNTTNIDIEEDRDL